MSEEKLRTAHKLINQGRYDAARHVLHQIEGDPTAVAWLEKLEPLKTKRGRSGGNLPVALIVMGFAIGIIVLILSIRFLPPILLQAELQQFGGVPYPDDYGDIEITEEEILYAELANYCYTSTGYGGELCLDWTDVVLAEHRHAVNACKSTLDLDDPEDRYTFGVCLKEWDVPPFY